MKFSRTVFLPLLFFILSLNLGIFLFFSGFFPTKTTISKSSGDRQESYRAEEFQSFNRVIFVVLDALRSDLFFSGSLPYTSSLLNTSYALAAEAEAHTPTVTLPRIKAMTSGDIPSFIDIIRNFAGTEYKDDNIISLMKKQNRTLLLYGDETWEKLFPGHFLRKDPTSSFYVHDSITVDTNVTRHLDGELGAADWDFLILHYLGIDHIGHVDGPFSSKMTEKLSEMDGVIKKLFSSLLEHNRTDTLLAVVSDHGMNDLGNHGGSSPAETSAFVFFASPAFPALFAAPRPLFGPPPLTPFFHYRESPYLHAFAKLYQVDVVPTLALLAGIPLPRTSVGVVAPDLLAFLPPTKQLAALMLNAEELFDHLSEISRVSLSRRIDLSQFGVACPPSFPDCAMRTVELGDLYRATITRCENVRSFPNPPVAQLQECSHLLSVVVTETADALFDQLRRTDFFVMGTGLVVILMATLCVVVLLQYSLLCFAADSNPCKLSLAPSPPPVLTLLKKNLALIFLLCGSLFIAFVSSPDFSLWPIALSFVEPTLSSVTGDVFSSESLAIALEYLLSPPVLIAIGAIVFFILSWFFFSLLRKILRFPGRSSHSTPLSLRSLLLTTAPQYLLHSLARYGLVWLFVLVLPVIHCTTLTSSSFVEEEHQTLYFALSTILLLLAAHITITRHHRGLTATSVLLCYLSFALLAIRLLRTMNQTGNKYLGGPDLASWLSSQDDASSSSLLSSPSPSSTSSNSPDVFITEVECVEFISIIERFAQPFSLPLFFNTMVEFLSVFVHTSASLSLCGPYLLTTYLPFSILNVGATLALLTPIPVFFVAYDVFPTLAHFIHSSSFFPLRGLSFLSPLSPSPPSNRKMVQWPASELLGLLGLFSALCIGLVALLCRKLALSSWDDLSLARSVYAVIAVFVAAAFWQFLHRHLQKAVGFSLVACVLAGLLLHRPHNTLLIPGVVGLTTIMATVLLSLESAVVQRHTRLIPLVLLGYASFFFFGNSNSIATIDLSGAYTGLESYDLFSVGALLAFAVFTGPLLVVFTWLLVLTSHPSSATPLSSPHTTTTPSLSPVPSSIPPLQTTYSATLMEVLYSSSGAMLLQGVQMAVMCIVLIAFRSHLFVWSVFAPKWLYVAVTTVLVSLGVLSVGFLGQWVFI